MAVMGLMDGTTSICTTPAQRTGLSPINPPKKGIRLRPRYWQTHFGWMAGRWRTINPHRPIKGATTPVWPDFASTDMTVAFAWSSTTLMLRKSFCLTYGGCTGTRNGRHQKNSLHPQPCQTNEKYSPKIHSGHNHADLLSSVLRR